MALKKQKKQLSKLLILLGVLFSALNINIACADNAMLYRVQLDLAYDGEHNVATRKELIKQALPRVLIQLSGNDQVLHSKQYITALKNIDSYVQLYEYSVQQITIQFNKPKIDQLLTDAAVAIWSENRPVTVLWLQDHNDLNSRKLMQYAKARGLLLVTPMLDAQDRQLITRDEINALNSSKILAASKRYHSNVALVGNINDNNDQGLWQSSWLFLIGEEQYYYNNHGDNLNALLQQVIAEFASKLATNYAEHRYLKTSAINTITISVTGIHDLASYVKVMQYLQLLPQIQEVCAKQLTESAALFTIHTVSDYENIKQNIEVSHILRIEQANPTENHLTIRLR